MRPCLAWEDGAASFAIDRRSVVASVDDPQLVSVPGAPPWLAGLCNRYGRALAVVDCAVLAGLAASPGACRQVLVVPAAGSELGVSLASPAREQLVPTGDPDGFFDRAEDDRGTRLIVLERLIERLSEAGGA